MSSPPVGRPRRGRLRFLALLLVVAGVVQVPLLWALHRLLGGAYALAPAALMTAGFLVSMRSTFRGQTGLLHVYLGLWPFFLWWTVALLFLVLSPLVLAALASGVIPTNTVLGAGVALAVVATLPSIVHRVRLRELRIPVANLAAPLHAFRIAQISDLHCGPFAGPARVAEWVDRVNRLEPDLIAVTGDLITHGPDYVRAVAAELGRLRARHGVFACMGNHDYFTDAEELVRALESAGLTVLRNRGLVVERDGARLFVAGVDDTWTGRHDMRRALAERPSDCAVVLLAHDPALFPEAAELGVELTLSGHTHGGQFALPGAARRINLARIITPFTSGLYSLEGAFLYVNRGLGTTGPPVRLGVPPEIAVLTLEPSSHAPGVAGA